MFYLAFLNHSDTSQYRPLFEALYGMEICLLFAFLVAFVPLSMSVFNATPLHLNIRCILLTWIVHGLFSTVGRFPLLFAQVCDIRDNQVALFLLTVGSVSREALFAYSSILSILVAVERLIGTYANTWYETENSSTFLVFIVFGGIAEAYSITASIFVVFEYYSIFCHLVLMATGGTVGFICFWAVLRYNGRMHNRLRPHYFGFAEYRIARNYQIRENLLVLKVLRNVAFDTIYYTIPPFVLFLGYVLTPTGTSLNLWRNLAVAIYDLFIALFAIVAPLRLIWSDIRFERGMRSMPLMDRLYDRWRKRSAKVESELHSSHRASADEQNQYFAQLDREWRSERAVSINIVI